MKLLTELHDLAEQQRIKLLMESNGILIHIANEDTARNLGFLHPAGKYAIHVVYDEQYEDAVKLMNNENHVVKKPVDIEEYKKALQSNIDSTRNKIMIFLVILLASLLGLFITLGYILNS